MVRCQARRVMRTRRYVCEMQRRKWPSAARPVGLRTFSPWLRCRARDIPSGMPARWRLARNQNVLQQNVKLFLRDP